MNVIFKELHRFAIKTALHCGESWESSQNISNSINYNTNFIDLVADVSLFSKHELLKYLKSLKVSLWGFVALLRS